ncbi:MAG: thiamine-phosphate kinase [Bacteroidales bacterium]|nr:thiamine-phosphate kinase [Bacteroidales bacterium]
MFEKKDQKQAGKSSELTALSELGEFGLIDRLTKNIQRFHPETLKGVGDDAAVIATGDKVMLLSTDLLVEGIHFDLTYMPLKHLGYKAAVVNISDIAAMNGIPLQMTVSIAVSSRFPVEALDELYSGILTACEKYHVDLVGGDTSSSVKGLLISVTITGTARPEEVVYRSGARSGDLLCVTGDLGSAYMGLLILEREKKVFQVNPAMQPELSGFDYQIGRQLKPEARTDIRNVLMGAGIRPTAMIDISDGLASEILHLCKQSKTGCRLFEEKIPIDPQTRELALEYNIIPTLTALSGGEDYELLFTVSQSDYEKIKDIEGITIIGHMTDNSGEKVMITPDGKQVELTAQGWNAWTSGLADKRTSGPVDKRTSEGVL